MAIKRKDELEVPGAVNSSVKEYDADHTLREAANARVASVHTGENQKSRYSVPSIEGINTEKFSYGNAPSYTSKYQNQIDDLMSSILNREQFSYDPESDPTYQQYKESYTRNGQRAMQDTIGQVSARTGGLASSYASAAGQQTYDGYMSALADKIPELRQLAYSMYQDDLNNQRANLDMLMALENADYGRYQDVLGQYNNDRNFNYGVFSDDRNFNYGIYTDDRNYNYQLGRDEIADKRYEDETAYNRDIYQSETTYNKALQKAQTLAAAGDFSGYKALGYTDAEIANLKKAYDRELAAAMLSGSGRSSSGGSGGGRGYTKAVNTVQSAALDAVNGGLMAAQGQKTEKSDDDASTLTPTPIQFLTELERNIVRDSKNAGLIVGMLNPDEFSQRRKVDPFYSQFKDYNDYKNYYIRSLR